MDKKTGRPRGTLTDEQLRRLEKAAVKRQQAEIDFRHEVLAIMGEGASFAEMAKATGLSTNTLQRWKRETGDESNA